MTLTLNHQTPTTDQGPRRSAHYAHLCATRSRQLVIFPLVLLDLPARQAKAAQSVQF